VDTYLLLGSSSYKDEWKEIDSTRAPPPDANSILDIYGNVLFEACIRDTERYEITGDTGRGQYFFVKKDFV
jgi:hypothetical protein